MRTTPRSSAALHPAALAVSLLLTSACATAPESHVVMPPPRALAPAAALPAADKAPSQAVQVRSELERLLGAHMLLADELVRAALRADTAQVQATRGSVDRNREQLAADVSRLAGVEAGGAFGKAWSDHVDALVAYAQAVHEGDASARAAARDRLVGLETALTAALSSAVKGTLPAAALRQAVSMHYEELLGQADAFAAGDPAAAYRVQREGFAHMVAVADVLARGIAAARHLPAGELDAPRRQLQSALGRLLAEHMGLMVQTMRAASDGSPDLAAAEQSLDGNTSDLGRAVAALYGLPAARQFLDIWAAHVEGLVRYASDAGGDRQAQLAEGRRELATYAPRLARFLATATQGRLPSIELAAALTEHDEHLRAQSDAYAAGDRVKAQQEADDGYQHMFVLAQDLSTAIGDAVAARLPRGGAATGGGGTAARGAR